MKSLSLATRAALFLCSAFTKVKRVAPALLSAKIISATPVGGAENLGSPLKGTNVSWLINPLYPNLKPLITFAPNSNYFHG